MGDSFTADHRWWGMPHPTGRWLIGGGTFQRNGRMSLLIYSGRVRLWDSRCAAQNLGFAGFVGKVERKKSGFDANAQRLALRV